MSDFGKFNPGDRLRIPAGAYNAFVDAARDYEQRQMLENGRDSADNGRIPARVRVRNNSGANRAALDVLIVQNTPPITPATNAESFKYNAILDGTAVGSSDTAKPFVVLAESINQNAVGWAYAAGMFVARVNIGNSNHTFCNVKSSDSTQLDSAYDGQARILYKQGTGASQLCLIQYPYLPYGSQSSPSTIGAASEGSESADSTTWTRSSSGTPLEIYVQTRTAYYHAGDEKLYGYVRKFTYDSLGLLISVGAETRVEIDVPDDC